jgi:two-component system, OmpR family, response regulator
MTDLRRPPTNDRATGSVRGNPGFNEAIQPALTGIMTGNHPHAGTRGGAGTQPRRINILIIEDDVQMRLLLRGCFEHAGFSVTEAGDATELWAAMAVTQFDLITLDVRLPGAGGLDLVQSIRRRSDIPVVMISAITNLVDRVTALERGADDFIVKPFDLMDLLARVRAVVRRYEARPSLPVVQSLTTHRRYRFDGWLFDAGRRELRNSAGTVKNLTDQELSLLELFVQHPQQELSRELIINHLHGDGDPAQQSPNTTGDPQSSRMRVDMQVSRLRKKLELPDHAVSIIKSVRGVGYVFAAAVEAV